MSNHPKGINKEQQNILTNKEPAYESLEGGWNKLPKMITCLPTVSSTAKLVYAELINIYLDAIEKNPNNPIIYPKQKTLARYVGVSQSVISDAITNLIEAGLVKKTQIKSSFPNRLRYILNSIPNEIKKFYKNGRKASNDDSYRNAYNSYRNAYKENRNAYKQQVSKTAPKDNAGKDFGNSGNGPNKNVLNKNVNHQRSTGNVNSTRTCKTKSKSNDNDDDKNSKKQKDAEQTIQNNPEIVFEPGNDEKQNNVNNTQRNPQSQRGNTSAPHEGKKQHDNMHTCSKKARQLTEHIDDELRRNGCQALSRKALERIPAQIDQFLKEYPFGLIVESIDEVVENLGNSDQSSKKISSAKYFLSTIEDKQEDWEYRRKERRKIAAAFKRRMEAEDE